MDCPCGVIIPWVLQAQDSLIMMALGAVYPAAASKARRLISFRRVSLGNTCLRLFSACVAAITNPARTSSKQTILRGLRSCYKGSARHPWIPGATNVTRELRNDPEFGCGAM